ncbi:RNA polymerase II associated protein 1 [Terramyces sp. JEL0728]|nr:RNA polymerase II associated protein 1 [Terramyces sp. JEL0728]
MISGDEELLELQKEFEKSTPSVKILKKSEKKSIFAQRNISVPAKIDSKTDLFGLVLSNITERNTDDSQAPVLKHPSGFPVAQHRSVKPIKKEKDMHETNMNVLRGMTSREIEEAQNEIYATFSKETIEKIKRNAAKKYGPTTNEDLIPEKETAELDETKENKVVHEGIMKLEEEKKLEWTKEVQIENQDQLRFDFQGHILDSSQDFEAISGLYHHGDQPNLAGYTIEELIHLTKSTFPSQKAFALQILACIVKKMYSRSYSVENTAIMIEKLKKENLVLACRIGLDAKHETVYCMAIKLLAVILGYENNGESIMLKFEKMSLFSNITVAMELDSQAAFKLKKKGVSLDTTELENGMAAILKLFQSDIILGLLLSNITTRLRYLFGIMSDDVYKIQMVYILTCIAQHSPSSAEDILATEGLVDVLSDVLFKTSWPAVHGLQLNLLAKILGLFKIMCHSSYESSVAFTNSKLVSGIVRFIAVYHDDDLQLQIVGKVFSIFDTLFLYGLSASILDSYRALFFEFMEKISKTFHVDNIGKSNPSEVKANAYSSFLKMLKTSLEKFRTQLDAGGANDAYLPFMSYLIKLVTESDLKFQEIKIFQPFYNSALELICTYFKQAATFQYLASDAFIEQQTKFFNNREALSFIVPEVPSINLADGAETLFDGGVATCIGSDEFGTITDIQGFSSSCYILSSQMELFNFGIQKLGFEGDSYRFDPVVKLIQNILNSNISTITNRWISIFGQGIYKFLEAWITLNTTIYRKTKEQLYKDCVVKAIYWYCSFALPGDDFTAHRLLTEYLISKDWVGTDFKQAQQCFDTLYNFKSLSNSNLMTVANPSKPPRSFMIQVQHSDQTALPLPNDWLFNFPTNFKNNPVADIDEVKRWLQFVTNSISENIVPRAGSTVSKFYNTMHLFFLTDVNGSDLYRDETVNSLLGKLLELLVKDGYADYDEDYLQQIPNFYNLYQDFIDHFIATSFGDRVFARYILFPVAMKFPHDFRATFWTKLFDYYKFFDLDEDQVPGKSFEAFLAPLDSNKEMDIVYKKAMFRGNLRCGSILHSIASQYKL